MNYGHLHFVIGIGAMKSLETLNMCKNRVTEIPLELAASTSITELFLNDNNLIEVPTQIMAMQSLKVFEAERKLFDSEIKCSFHCAS